MSFDIGLACFQNGEPATFPRTLLERAFDLIADRSDPRRWVLKGGGSTLYMGEGAEITGFAVNRPPEYEEFWKAVMDVLRQTPSVLYWPGGGCVVANPAVTKHLPDYLIEAKGKPEVTTDPLEILEIIVRS